VTKYIVQIDMAEFEQAPLWEDCTAARFDTQEQALAHIEWMKKEYGHKIEYRIRTEPAN
jgi:hypothetical protein